MGGWSAISLCVSGVGGLPKSCFVFHNRDPCTWPWAEPSSQHGTGDDSVRLCVTWRVPDMLPVASF